MNIQRNAAQDDNFMSLARSLVLGLAATLAVSGISHAQAADIASPAADPAAAPKPARTQLGESVAAVVNDEVISTYDLRQRMLLLMVTSGVQPTEQNVAEVQREAMRSLIDEHLEMQEIKHVEEKQKDLHMEPTAKEIDDEIDDMAQQNNVKRAQLMTTLKAAGINPDTLREQLTAQMAWRHYMGGRFGSNIRIGDEQVAAAEARAVAAAEKSQYLVSEIFIDSSRVGGPLRRPKAPSNWKPRSSRAPPSPPSPANSPPCRRRQTAATPAGWSRARSSRCWSPSWRTCGLDRCQHP